MATKDKIIQNLKTLGRNVLLVSATVIVFVLILEISFRYYWFDFYSKEVTFLNEKSKQKKHTKTILLLGDSFTASANNYCDILNDNIHDVRFINAGVPGFGIQEESIIAESRIEEFKPNAVILQIFVGNDLLDLEKPVNWSTSNTTRNIYWTFSNTLLSLRYINYKAGQFKTNMNLDSGFKNTKLSSKFSVDNYSARERILLNADNKFLSKSIFIYDDYSFRFKKYQEYIEQIEILCEARNIPLILLIIPTACQVTKLYQSRDEQLGAIFKNSAVQDTLYPFLHQLRNTCGSRATILNPLPIFQEQEKSGNALYYENDIHLNPMGQKILADFLIQKQSSFIWK